MAAPNIVNVTTITGKTAVHAVTTSANSIITNSDASNQVYKVNSVYVSNVDGTNAAEVNIDVFRDSTAFHVVKTLIVPADATVDVLSKSIYLEEGDALRIAANTTNRLEVVASYEEIT